MADGAKTLSKKLTEMRFMQRKLEAKEREKKAQEQRKSMSSSHWVVEFEEEEAEQTVPVEYEPSLLAISGSGVIGRRSYMSFNRNVEKLVQEKELEVQRLKGADVMDVDISKKEMAARHSKFIATQENQDETSNNSARAVDADTSDAAKEEDAPEDAPPAKRPRNSDQQRTPVKDTDRRTHGRFKFIKPSE